uniref:TROVE domain-containing protein n=1 Tax=Trichuris muris TaxID=70415 RepID=A0A5S6Q6K0_TRIMR
MAERIDVRVEVIAESVGSCDNENAPQSTSWPGIITPISKYIPEELQDADGQMQMADESQVQNDAGGYVFRISDINLIRRFLILGCEGGTYYVCEKDLKETNAEHLIEIIDRGDGMMVLNEALEISESGRAPKQGPAIYCLALCARYATKQLEPSKRSELQRKAYEYLPRICRIPTHLFEFVSLCETLNEGSTGWGRSHRTAVTRWYLDKDPHQLAYLVTKYGKRCGWKHLDVLRLAHPKTTSEQADHNDIFLYAKSGFDAVVERRRKLSAAAGCEGSSMEELCQSSKAIALLQAVHQLKQCKDDAIAAELIKKHRLVREHVPTSLLHSPLVWAALLEEMPFTAMLRCLNRLTIVGVLSENSEATADVVAKLRNIEHLRKSRVHPMALLIAHATYKHGMSYRGNLTWNPVESIVQALEESFYNSFAIVEPTGKRFCIALDISGSMSACLSGSSLSAAHASTAMCLIHFRTEPECSLICFSVNVDEVDMASVRGYSELWDKVSDFEMSETDCALPMLWAAANNRLFDVFVIYTDNETWFGHVHPHVALQYYRKKTGIEDAKLIVVGMTASICTIADPNDPYMLDVVGFDPSVPEIMNQFILGKI